MPKFTRKVGADPAIYPYSLRDFKSDFPSVLIGADMATVGYPDGGVYPVAEVAKPTFNPATERIESTVILDNGTWTESHSVVALGQPEIDEFALRYRRRIRSLADQKINTVMDALEDVEYAALDLAAAAYIKASGGNVPAVLQATVTEIQSLYDDKAAIRQAGKQITTEFNADPATFYATYGDNVTTHPAWPL